MQNPPLTQYEKERNSQLKKNDEKLEELGMRPLVSSLKSFGVKNIKGKTNADDQSHDKEHDNDEEYNPEEEIDIQSDDTSEVHDNKL